MNMFNELEDKSVIVLFSEWQNKPRTRVYLKNFTNPDVDQYKKTKYYIFDGYFVEPNRFNIEPKKWAKLWFSKACFDIQIIRLFDFNTSKHQDIFDIEVDVLRPSQRILTLSNLEVIHSTLD